MGQRQSALEKVGLTMTGVNPHFWAGKRVLITGHTGFKGSWLCLWLQSMGAKVHGLALAPSTTPSLFHEADVAAGMQSSTLGDIRDLSTVLATMQACQPEVVIHMAAQALVRYSYQAPVETYASNVMGTVHVLESARQTGGVRAVVNVTSDKCYENRELDRGYREDEPMGGFDPYSSSKGCAELVSTAYRRSFLKDAGIALATARAGNVIGGGDWATDRLIPDVLRALSRHEVVLIRHPQAIRPWQHVLEPLAGYLLLAQRLHAQGQTDAEGWNFGPADEDARPVQWVVERLCEAWGPDAAWTPQLGAHPHEAQCLKLDISKALHRLNWAPQWPLVEALRLITDWHRSWIAGVPARDLCMRQIALYGSSP